jgi:DNA modification methylase
MIKWTLKELAIKDLKNHPKNPRQIKKDQLARLAENMNKFGLIDKPIVNADMTIIGGHQRIRILKKQKVKTIECWVAPEQLSDDQVDELCISLNLHGGAWDFDILANEWEPLKLLEYGFTEEQLLGLAEGEGSKLDDEYESELLEPPKNPKTKPGDIYILGNHRLICGDSTDKDTVDKVLNGETPILMCTDPPYGVEYDASWRSKIKTQKGKTSIGKVMNDNLIDWSESWKQFRGTICYIWHASIFASEVQKSLEKYDFELKYQIIWVKQQAFNRGDYHFYHEPCFYMVKKGKNHNWNGDHKQRTVWEIDSLNPSRKSESLENNEKTAHSTQKPLECMAKPIRNNTAPGEGVYDPFLGSGTTLIAAEQLGRKCFGIELDPAYVDIIVDRWVKYREKNGLDAKVTLNDHDVYWNRIIDLGKKS